MHHVQDIRADPFRRGFAYCQNHQVLLSVYCLQHMMLALPLSSFILYPVGPGQCTVHLLFTDRKQHAVAIQLA